VDPWARHGRHLADDGAEVMASENPDSMDLARPFSATPDAVRVPAPLLGQHNDDVLGELLRLSQADIDRLTTAGVVVAVA
jgi:crotonobetainyl-CoA:carnitine CoA-transferase CaiB-like acyl-CoA transferase